MTMLPTMLATAELEKLERLMIERNDLEAAEKVETLRVTFNSAHFDVVWEKVEKLPYALRGELSDRCPTFLQIVDKDEKRSNPQRILAIATRNLAGDAASTEVVMDNTDEKDAEQKRYIAEVTKLYETLMKELPTVKKVALCRAVLTHVYDNLMTEEDIERVERGF